MTTCLGIRFTAIAFRKLLSTYVFRYFPFGFEGRMWDLIVSVPDHCLSFYFPCNNKVMAFVYEFTDIPSYDVFLLVYLEGFALCLWHFLWIYLILFGTILMSSLVFTCPRSSISFCNKMHLFRFQFSFFII